MGDGDGVADPDLGGLADGDRHLVWRLSRALSSSDLHDVGAVPHGAASSAPATVTITVNAVNDAPIARSGNISIGPDDAVTVNLLLAASDPDGDSLTVKEVTITYGANQTTITVPGDTGVEIVSSSNFQYVFQNAALFDISQNFSTRGIDTLRYTVTDGMAESTGTITITATTEPGSGGGGDTGLDGAIFHP
jgi:hypothetical protein